MGHIEMKCYDIASIPGKVIYEDIKRTKNDTDIPPNIEIDPMDNLLLKWQHFYLTKFHRFIYFIY